MSLNVIKKNPLVTKVKRVIYALIYVIYDIVTWVVKLKSREKSLVKKMLIVRVDEIGDYMLWRSFLDEIVNANRFKGYEIDLCGNLSWKGIFDLLDKQNVANAFWMDKQSFRNSLIYRYRFLAGIYLRNYDVVINTTYARDRINDDTIVAAARAANSYGMAGSTRTGKETYNSKLYTSLFFLKSKPVFEFETNKKFTESITGDNSEIDNTLVSFDKLPPVEIDLPFNYFVIFPGTRNRSRIWPTQNFIDVSDYLYDTTGYTAVVCGSQSDAVYTVPFCAGYKHPFLDLTSKTSLPQLLTVLKKAKCLISVDTGSVHLAAAVNCPVFGVFNGTYYKRFAPYPKSVYADFFAIYPDEIEAELENPEIVIKKYQVVVDIPYATVAAGKMIDKIKQYQYLL